ncbi:MAG: hypothetical protein FJX74_06625 [Armatimonadetes bacterium]|nr:hypothetical protein [Armatimonadota bacterium]
MPSFSPVFVRRFARSAMRSKSISNGSMVGGFQRSSLGGSPSGFCSPSAGFSPSGGASPSGLASSGFLSASAGGGSAGLSGGLAFSSFSFCCSS